MNGYIYALVDPRDGAVRYVGQTVRALELRRRQHVAKPCNAGLHNWIAELKATGAEPSIKLLEEVAAERLHEAETSWINEMLSRNSALLNVVLTVLPRRPRSPRAYVKPPKTGVRFNLHLQMAYENQRRAYQNKKPLTFKELSQMTGLDSVMLSRLAYHRTRMIDFSTIAALCNALNCQPGDLFEYIPDTPDA